MADERPAVPDPFLAAVKAVPHREDCITLELGWSCSCDREERIAKGLRAAVSYDTGETRAKEIQEYILAAFTEAARG